jgi:hypothetical protein
MPTHRLTWCVCCGARQVCELGIFVLAGWKLGIVEAIGITILVGEAFLTTLRLEEY